MQGESGHRTARASSSGLRPPGRAPAAAPRKSKASLRVAGGEPPPQQPLAGRKREALEPAPAEPASAKRSRVSQDPRVDAAHAVDPGWALLASGASTSLSGGAQRRQLLAAWAHTCVARPASVYAHPQDVTRLREMGDAMAPGLPANGPFARDLLNVVFGPQATPHEGPGPGPHPVLLKTLIEVLGGADMPVARVRQWLPQMALALDARLGGEDEGQAQADPQPRLAQHAARVRALEAGPGGAGLSAQHRAVLDTHGVDRPWPQRDGLQPALDAVDAPARQDAAADTKAGPGGGDGPKATPVRAPAAVVVDRSSLAGSDRSAQVDRVGEHA